jgi:hypothetical protein
MHAAGVVHRDLKPANVILSPSGPRVVDLGIARAIDETSITRTGVLIGSPAWLSPEHYRDEEVGPATDVHAWGLLVAYAATGRLPFGSGRPEVLAVRVLENEVDLTGLDPDLGAIVAEALAKAPGDRPSAPEVLASVTEAWRHRTDAEVGDLSKADAATALIERTWVMPNVEDLAWVPTTRQEKPLPKRSRRWPVLILGSAAVIGVIAVAAELIPSHGAESQYPLRNGQVTKASESASSSKVAGSGVTSNAPPSSTAGAPLRGSRIHFSSISVIIPAGWSAQSGNGMVGPSVCLLIPNHGKNGSCTNDGLLIESWADTTDEPNLDDPQVWTGDNDPSSLPQCFRRGEAYIPGISAKVVSSNGLRKIGNRSAIFYEYHADCETGFSFNPRIWWLPKTRLMMTVVALPDRYHETVDGIAASIRFN